MKALILFFTAVTVVGCSPILSTMSSAPPTRIATLDNMDDEIRISKGVALAISCRNGFWYDPCENASAQTDNPQVAAVVRAHLEKYRRDTGFVYEGYADERAVFVLAGVTPGRTTLRIAADDGTRELEVIVQ